MSIIEKILKNIRTEHGYKILQDGIKKSSILDIEGVCPCCGNEHITYIDKGEYTSHKHQFIFNCNKCGTKWQSNRYTSTFERSY